MSRNTNNHKKVIVAMSGGVDSSVAAFLLLEQGYEVIGATFINGYGDPAPRAAKICEQLGIEHRVIDIASLFEEQIVKPFVDDYLSGRTPNPCVNCNERVKFSVFLPLLQELAADFMATGHYVQLLVRNGNLFLRRAICESKDQSYFMYRIPQNILAKCLFPLGELTKEQVRDIAAEHGLYSAGQKDSYDICFIESGDYRQCLNKYAKNIAQPGDIIDLDGNILGRHSGLANYTVGQRRGIDIALGYPAYVVKLDTVNNRLLLGSRDNLLSSKARVDSLVWAGNIQPSMPVRAEVKIRYRADAVSATIVPVENNNHLADIIFDKPVWAVTPGQSAVFYDDDIVVGGGYII